MENASKALIIAGAILLSILIIGLGMFIYQKAAGALSGADLSSQKVTAYNSEFEQYEGTQSGSNVRALCDAIRAHNNGNVDDASLNITIKYNNATYSNQTAGTTAPTSVVTAATVNAEKTKISAGGTYYVVFGYDSNSGYIVDCQIFNK